MIPLLVCLWPVAGLLSMLCLLRFGPWYLNDEKRHVLLWASMIFGYPMVGGTILAVLCFHVDKAIRWLVKHVR